MVRFETIGFYTINNVPGVINIVDRIGIFEAVLLQHFFNLGGLRDMDREASVWHSLPEIKTSKEPGNISHKFNLNISAEAILECLFDRIRSTKIGKVVDIQPDVDRGFTFDEDTGVNAGFIWKWFQTKTFESIRDLLIPMAERSA